MFLLRTAARTFSAAPSKALLARSRPITTIAPLASRSRHQQWSISSFQRRFASDDAAKTEAAAVPDNFAQTAAEAPVEDNLTPAQQQAQAEPTDASATVGADALAAATETASTTRAPRRGDREAPKPNNMLYIGNLYYEVTTEQLQRVFSRFGDIESVKIIYDNRGLSRGFGYVEFKNTSDAQAAVDNLDMQVFEGRNLVVQFHKAKPNSKTLSVNGSWQNNPPSKTLFIGNMSFEMSDSDLNNLFRDIKNVRDVRVAIDRRTGQPRGFAHADFIDVASAAAAKEALSNTVVYGRTLRIDFSKPGTSLQRDQRREDKSGEGA